MRKFSTPGLDVAQSRLSCKPSAVLAILFGLAVSPLVYEASAICAGQWRSLSGPIETVATPAFDSLSVFGHSVTRQLNRQLAVSLTTRHWRPAVVIPLGCLWAALVCALLRRP